MFGPFSREPNHQVLIQQCWSKRGAERRFTVPPKIKRKLCELAIAHVMELQRQNEHARPLIEASLQRSQSAAEADLRNQGTAKRTLNRRPSIQSLAL